MIDPNGFPFDDFDNQLQAEDIMAADIDENFTPYEPGMSNDECFCGDPNCEGGYGYLIKSPSAIETEDLDEFEAVGYCLDCGERSYMDCTCEEVRTVWGTFPIGNGA